MNAVKSLILFCVVVFSMMGISRAQNVVGGRVIDIKIYFPYDKAYIDPAYMDNASSLQLVDSLLCDSLYLSTIRTIEITAQSSPEGSIQYNERLSNRRRDAIEEYFTLKYPEIDRSLWIFRAKAENWEEFESRLHEALDMPNRAEVLRIAGDSSRDYDSREWLLKSMDGGSSWQYIKSEILPSQRYGASVHFIPMITRLVNAPSPIQSFASTSMRVAVPEYIEPVEYVEPRTLIALKTNLVWDLASVINLGVEVPLGDRFSVVGEVVYPWWRSWPADFTMQIESYHGELKYWLGDRAEREKLQGWSVGVYGGWGRYDIQPFSRTGVQGSFFDAGIEAGYAHPIAKNLHLEYTLGVGYVSTTYNDYKMVNNTDEFGDIKVIPYPWITNKLTTVLPTRFGVSLVWTIKSRGGAR